MARTDEALYTGLTSASTARVKEDRKKVNEEKQRVAAELFKDNKVVFELVDQEIASIPRQIWDLAGLTDDEEHYKSSLIALKKYDAFLASFRLTLQNKLRVRLPKEQKESEDA